MKPRIKVIIGGAAAVAAAFGWALAAPGAERAAPTVNAPAPAALAPIAASSEVAAANTIVAATSEEESGLEEVDVPITGPELEQAKAIALAYLGKGTVTETEVGDEESYYEVEVTLPDGSQVDVQLDEVFKVVGVEGDGRGEDG